MNGRVDADYSCDLTRVPHICWACRTQVRWSLEFLADTRRIYLVRVQLVDTGLATIDNASVQLTPAGIERSDAIGPWLYSPAVRRLSEDYAWR